MTTFFNIVVQLLVFDDQRAAWIRPTGIVLLLICAYVDKIWVRTSILVFIYMVAVTDSVNGDFFIKIKPAIIVAHEI